MKWSYRIGRWFGIDVHAHLTFALLLAWIGLGTLAGTGSLGATLVSLVFVLALFGFVVLHEYGHALTARRFGIRTRQITLYPIGGVASLEGMPERPREQLLVALAGPAVNFALAGALAAVAGLLGVSVFAAPSFAGTAVLLRDLVQVNLLLGAFNLLPALPMDGGRVLKALLSMRMAPARATVIAARVARVVAIGMASFGLFAEPTRPMLVVIAAFVWFASSAEARFERTRRASQRYNAWPTDAYRTGTTAAKGVGPTSRTPPVGTRRVRVVLVQGPFGPVLRAVPID